MEKEFLNLTQCALAADYAEPGGPLDKQLDSSLISDAVRHQWSVLQQKGYPVNPMTLSGANAQVRGELAGESSRGAAKQVLKWYGSSYCQEVITGYQDAAYGKPSKAFERGKSGAPDPLILRKALHLAESKYDAQAGDTRCSHYQSQWAAASAGGPQSRYRRELMDGLHKTVADSTQNLQGDQKRALDQLLVQERSGQGETSGLFSQISESCRGGVGKTVQNLQQIKFAPSDRTLQLQAILESIRSADRACGDFERVYCRSELFASTVEATFHKSRQCDAGLQDNCPEADALGWLQSEFKRRELAALGRRKAYLERYVARPADFSREAQSALDAHLLACERAAVKDGMKPHEVIAHARKVCAPQAIEEVARPQQEELDQISAAMYALQAMPGQ